jgi:hypothetical protein
MGKGIDTFRERAKHHIEDRPRTGTGVARFTTATAGSIIIIHALLPETIGPLAKDVDANAYLEIAAGLGAAVTVVIAYIRELAEILKKHLVDIWMVLAIGIFISGCAVIRVEPDGSYVERSIAHGICLSVGTFGSLGHCDGTSVMPSRGQGWNQEHEPRTPEEVVVRILLQPAPADE